jgi:mannose-6-phosphate isomerase
MLVQISNAPRDYAWGSTHLIAELEGRAPASAPEAEVWFGDHPADPAVTAEGATLDAWLEAHGAERLTYLLKLLAAASPLSIQAHPSIAQAREGFAREEAAGIARDAATRTYRDANHKPELIVALSETFTALAGLRPLEETRRLLEGLGESAEPILERLPASGGPSALRDTIEWLLSGDAADTVDAVVGALATAPAGDFSAEIATIRRIADEFPGDAGVIVALLMNLVILHRGEGLFLPAGVLHAYLEGLGVELMAASDNVLRGGLTPKHIDVAELVSVLDPTPARPPVLEGAPVSSGLQRFDVRVPDFALLVAEPSEGAPVTAALSGTSIAVVTRGEATIAAGDSAEPVILRPGQAVLAVDESSITLSGDAQVFIAGPGR